MQLKLKRRVSRDTNAEPNDVRALKKALNRLGYYTPPKKSGITKIADAAMLEALKKFQRDQKLKSDGIILPDGETAKAINKALSQQSSDKSVILQWHCAGDDNSCGACLERDKTLVMNDDEDTPDCLGNCRCWVTQVDARPLLKGKPSEEVRLAIIKAEERLQQFKERNFNMSAQFLAHYMDRTGLSIVVNSNALDNEETIQTAIADNQERFEKSFIQKNVEGFESKIYKALSHLKDGDMIEISDQWHVDKTWYDVPYAVKDLDLYLSFGSMKIKSETKFTLQRRGNKIQIKGRTTHSIDDFYDFNDDIRGDTIFKFARILAKNGYAKNFAVYWKKEQSVTGEIEIENGKYVRPDFIWKDMGR